MVGKPCMVMGHKFCAAEEEDGESSIDLHEVDCSICT